MSAAFEKKQVQRYEEAFRKLGNRRDLLPVNCIGDFLRLTGTSATPEELDNLVPEYNVNGFISFPSTLDLLARLQGGCAGNERQDLLMLFKLLDENDSGEIYADELRQACLLAGDSLREKEFDHLMHATGLAGKERLSLFEFLEVLLHVPKDPF